MKRNKVLSGLLSMLAVAGWNLAAGQPLVAQDKQQWKSESWEHAVASEMQKRLAILNAKIEQQRKLRQIPGLALAVVQNGEIVFARGFGVADVENKKPVTPETLFAIGSSTKAFTATVIGMLADEGKLQFDDPVNKHLPDFILKVDTGDEEVTVRDLLAHRTGYTRMGILWAGGGITRSEVIACATNAKPFADFRKTFLYNNVMYMAAGYAAGQATDSTWEDLIANRIFKPLEMSSSNTSVAISQEDPRLSLGYVWSKEKEQFKKLPMRDLNLIGPAGSINSNVLDMTQWLKFQLAKGEFNGKRLMSEESHSETWSPQMSMGDSDYGLGWMLRKWNGKKVVEHGGNIDGFSAQVSMLPSENIGYVLLANVTVTPMQQSSIDMVFDTLLGDIKEGEDVGSAEAIDESHYLGEYIANAGGLRDAGLKVLVQNGNLAIDVPGQMVYELKAPDEDGKWYFAATNAIAVKFVDDGKSDQMLSMIMYQAGMEFECPRKGVEMPIEIPLEQIQPYLGKYRDEKADREITVTIKNNRLTVDPGGQAPIEFFPPNDDGWWAMRANKSHLQLKFNKDENDEVTSVTRKQGGNEVEMKRTAGDTEGDVVKLPSGSDVVQLLLKGHRGETLDDSHFKLIGNANYVHQGAKGTVELWLNGKTSYRSAMDFGKMGSVAESIDGQSGWAKSTFAPFEKLEGQKLLDAQLRHPLWFLNSLEKQYDDFSVAGAVSIGERKTWKLQLQGKGEVADRTLYVDQESGLLLREDTSLLALETIRMPVTIDYSNYRSVGGYQVPFTVVSKNAAVGELEMNIESVEKLDSAPDYALQKDDGE